MQKSAGYSVRTYNLARSLAESGNEVSVILPKDKPFLQSVEGVTVYGLKGFIPRPMLQVLSKVAGISRPTSIYFYDFLFAFRVSKLIREMDVVQIEQQASGALFVPFIRRVLKRPVVLDCHDVFQALRLKQTGILRRMLETFLEKLAYRNANLVLTVSENEKRLLISSSGLNIGRIVVVPNGVDTRSFTVSGEQGEARENYGLQDSRIIVYVGNLDYPPNREAVQALSSLIAPKVQDKVKNAKFLVVGRSKDKMEMPRLVFTGFVDNLAEILNISEVAVAPLLHGSGTRLKILEYFSCGLPVVSTSIGAEGLGVKNGVNIFIEDSLESFALRIIELLRNKNLAETVGKAARKLVADSYDWSQITRNMEIALHGLLS
jgi:glycosyltransferase involved in cell wall biosynthesis